MMRVAMEGLSDHNFLRIKHMLDEIPGDLHVTTFGRANDNEDFGICFNLVSDLITAVAGEYIVIVYHDKAVTLERSDIYEMRYFLAVTLAIIKTGG